MYSRRLKKQFESGNIETSAALVEFGFIPWYTDVFFSGIANSVCFRLVREVNDISETVESLHKKLQEAEAQHQQLLMTRANLESDLHTKVNSLFIDREKCLGMRRSFPITANIKYWRQDTQSNLVTHL